MPDPVCGPRPPGDQEGGGLPSPTPVSEGPRSKVKFSKTVPVWRAGERDHLAVDDALDGPDGWRKKDQARCYGGVRSAIRGLRNLAPWRSSG